MVVAYRREMEKLRQQLETFENGSMQIRHRDADGPWQDITQQQIASLMDETEQYKRGIKRLEKDMTNDASRTL